MEMVKVLEEIFKAPKPVIGMVHLLPLLGSPKYGGEGIKPILDRAIKDTKALEKGGIDGILIENFGDAPFKPTSVNLETLASMTLAVKEVSEATDLPIGVNVLRNDAKSALAIAYATNARFIRVNVYTEAMITDQGIINSCAHEVQRYRRGLGAENVKIFADIHGKHAQPLARRPIEEVAKDAAYRGLADALIVTGPRTGVKPSINDVTQVKEAVPDKPVLVGSGVNKENAKEFLRYADGAIVGTSLKVDSVTTNPVSESSVMELMKAVQRIRKSLLLGSR